MMRTHVVGSTEWPAAVTDGLSLDCQVCGLRPHVDYRVDDAEWRRVVRPGMRRGVVCLDCFLSMGGDPESLVEIQVTSTGVVTVVAVPVVAYRYGEEA